MKVESIDSRMPFKFSRPRAHERLPEGVKFLAGAALVFWGPLLSLCYVIGHALPLYLLIFPEALGLALGVFLYKNQPDGFPPRSYVNHVPDVPRPARAGERRKVA